MKYGLSVSLVSPGKKEPVTCPTCGGVGYVVENADEVFSRGITHNLADMAVALNIYAVVWRPEETGITKAEQMIPYLEKGIEELRKNPENYRTYNSSNGWGTLENLQEFLVDYLKACKQNPDAKVFASR